MRLPGRIAATIEILNDIAAGRPANVALADWGRTHRFAGAGDRAAIGNLTYDVLRRRTSLAWAMGDDAPGAAVAAALVAEWGLTPDNVGAAFADPTHGPGALDAAALAALAQLAGADGEAAVEHPDDDLAGAAARADVPEWLWPQFADAFGQEALAEGQALASRAPLDLRVNTLKSDRARVMKALLRDFGARHPLIEGPLADTAVRFSASQGPGRTPNVQTHAGYQKGHFEIQDAGSQVMCALVNAQAGEQVLDLCAGGGGKTLGLAAAMGNTGQIYAYDIDRTRLAPIHARLSRAGVRNVQVISPAPSRPAAEGAVSGPAELEGLIGRIHRVVIDAPCSGSGVWRRRPDAKWRLSPQALEERQAEQRAILRLARHYVRPGGLLCYITCSVLACENENQIATFLDDNPDFELLSCEEVWRERFGFDAPQPWSADAMTVTLTPAATGTDGFFFAVMERMAA